MLNTLRWSNMQHLNPIEHRYNVRDATRMYLRDVGAKEVKEFFADIPAKDLRVEIFKRVKPCCPEEDKYIGSFSAKEVLVSMAPSNT